MSEYTRIKKVLNKKQESILTKSGVVATGIAYKIVDGKKTDELALVCSVDKKRPLNKINKKDLIPEAIKGVVTDVIETGVIKALHTKKYRPAPGGVSIGHVDVTCGTLGCIVMKNGKQYILSNNHVLANSNDAEIGDSIIQPGGYDSGEYPKDHIANLADFIPLNFPKEPSNCSISNLFTKTINLCLNSIGSRTRLQSVTQTKGNLVDAAIAIPLQEKSISNEITGLGKINGVTSPELGMKINKSGRTTGLTTGEIVQMNVATVVQYGEGKSAIFTDQFMTGFMSAGGDSGSAALTEDNCIVGLLYAGSDQVTLYNRIENVFELLQIALI